MVTAVFSINKNEKDFLFGFHFFSHAEKRSTKSEDIREIFIIR